MLPLGYKEIAKQHQKHMNDEQFHNYPKTKPEYYSYVSEHSKAISEELTKEEFNKLFWEHLVSANWKLDNSENSVHIVLVCPECDKSLYTVHIKTINKVPDSRVEYLKNPKRHLDSHAKECKAISKA